MTYSSLLPKNSNVYVSWSGGLDSTALIFKLLENGNNVSAGYIKLLNNENKTKCELAAIDKIIPYIYNKYSGKFVYRGAIGSLDYENCCDHNVRLHQVVPWLMGNFYYANMVNNEYFALGYVVNDCAISFLPEITKLWNSMLGLTNSKVKIVFPLIKEMKSDLVEYLNDIDFKIYSKTWTCETPTKDGEECKKCGPCITKENLLKHF